jgi:hypothetical protein
MSITCIVCGNKYTKNERPIHMYEHQEAGELQNFPDLNGTFTKPSERDMKLHKSRLYGRKSRINHKCIVCNYKFNSNRDKLAHMYKYLKTPHAEQFSPELKLDIEKSFCIRSISKSKSRLKHDIKPMTPIRKKSTNKIQQKCISKIAFLEAKLQLTAVTNQDETIIVDEEMNFDEEMQTDDNMVEVIELDKQDIQYQGKGVPIPLLKPHLHVSKIPIPKLPVPVLLGPFF